MKRQSLVVLILGLTVAWPGEGQSQTPGPPRIGILAGVNSATVGGKDADDADRLTGLLAGVYVVKPIAGALAFRPELLYSQKGAEGSFDEEDVSGKAKIKVAYLEVPVLLQYEATESSDVRPHVYAGPSFSFKTTCKLEGSGGGVSVSFDCDDVELDVKSFDLGGVVGAGLTFPIGGLRAAIGARYQHGFTDLTDDAVVRNRVLSLYAGLEFGRRN
jgi:hypothetical protein